MCRGCRGGRSIFFRKVAEYSRLRVRFVEIFVSRGLGIIQPRTLDPALLEKGLTLVLPGIEAESVFTYGMCDGLADGGVEGQIRVFNWGLPFPGGIWRILTRVDPESAAGAARILRRRSCGIRGRIPGGRCMWWRSRAGRGWRCLRWRRCRGGGDGGWGGAARGGVVADVQSGEGAGEDAEGDFEFALVQGLGDFELGDAVVWDDGSAVCAGGGVCGV